MMLADEPLSTHVHPGGGVSVHVNGGVDGSIKFNSDSSEGTCFSAVDSSNFGAESDSLAERCTSGWANATITWRNGAQPYSLGHNNDVSDSPAGRTSITTPPQMVNTEPSLENQPPSTQLVHVIRVQTSTPDIRDIPKEHVEYNMTNVDIFANGQLVNNNPKTRIRVTAHPNRFYHQDDCVDSLTDVAFGKDKISVVVGPSLNHIIKDEDERSSSGASSAPGSDCERSDSDREGDDGTDSGFSSSRRSCANIIVNAKNSNNVANTFLSSSRDIPSKGTSQVQKACNNKSDVKLTLSSYAEKKETTHAPSENLWDMQFHVNELEKKSVKKSPDCEDVLTKISTAHALLSGPPGMYTLKNRVRSSIMSLLVQSASNRNYDQEERGRVVFYTTSMGVIRTTFDRCRKVRKILETLMVKFEERDVFMNRAFQQEVRERLATSRVTVPQVFVEGRHLGTAEVLEQLNEIGHLRELLRPYKRQSVSGTCQQCGGYKYLLCTICGGSKKSINHRHHFSEDLVALRCVTCDESGLIRCPQCLNGEG